MNKMLNTLKDALNRLFHKPWVSGSCYRIIKDKYCGYEVQKHKRFLFCEWWQQSSDYAIGINTHSSIDDAKKWIDAGLPKRIKKEDVVVWHSGNCR